MVNSINAGFPSPVAAKTTPKSSPFHRYAYQLILGVYTDMLCDVVHYELLL